MLVLGSRLLYKPDTLVYYESFDRGILSYLRMTVAFCRIFEYFVELLQSEQSLSAKQSESMYVVLTMGNSSLESNCNSGLAATETKQTSFLTNQ